MSDHIAHIGICDDTFRLALRHPHIDATFKTLMMSHCDAAHMGSVTRGADKWSIQLLVWARTQLQNAEQSQPDPLAGQKLAFVLGALTHRAADRLTKPITNCWREPGEANESKIMQDLCVWKEVYGGGKGPHAEPFTALVFQALPGESQARAEEVFRVMLRRSLIAMHTIAPDSDHIQPWLSAFLNRLQTFPKSLEQYASLASEWDEAKVRKYLLDKNFYCREDELIHLARALQHGQDVPPEHILEAAHRTGPTHSRYARAVAKALDYLVAATELFQGRISPDEASRRLDIGVPELSLQN